MIVDERRTLVALSTLLPPSSRRSPLASVEWLPTFENSDTRLWRVDGGHLQSPYDAIACALPLTLLSLASAPIAILIVGSMGSGAMQNAWLKATRPSVSLHADEKALEQTVCSGKSTPTSLTSSPLASFIAGLMAATRRSVKLVYKLARSTPRFTRRTKTASGSSICVKRLRSLQAAFMMR